MCSLRLSGAHRRWIFRLHLMNRVHHDQLRPEFRREVARPDQRRLGRFADRSRRSPCRSASTIGEVFCKCAPVHTGASTSCRTLAVTEPSRNLRKGPYPCVGITIKSGFSLCGEFDDARRGIAGHDDPSDLDSAQIGLVIGVQILAPLGLQRRDPAGIDRAAEITGNRKRGNQDRIHVQQNQPGAKMPRQAAACWAAPSPCSEKSTGSRIFFSFMATGSRRLAPDPA